MPQPGPVRRRAAPQARQAPQILRRSVPTSLAVALAAFVASAAALAGPAAVDDRTLLFIAPANHTLPFVGLQGGELRSGILKDLGEALAVRVGRQARFVVMPAKRAALALAQGEADGLCYTSPQWIDGAGLHWSRPLFDYVGVIARRGDAAAVTEIGQLAGVALGTVSGYHYPEVEQALGERFVRDDAPDMDRNLAKLAAGRVGYALTEKLTLDYSLRESPQQGLQLALQTTRYPTYCAFSPSRGLPLPGLDRALDAMLADGSLAKLLARYR